MSVRWKSFFLQPIQSGLLASFTIGQHYEQRCGMAKHWHPKFKWLRKKKVVKVDLPNFHEKDDVNTKEETKRRMRERGVMPPRPWMERSFYLSSVSVPCKRTICHTSWGFVEHIINKINILQTGEILEPYVPPEGDGKRSVFSKAGAKQNIVFLEKKSKSMMAVRKIRSYDEDFDPKEFAIKAQDIYIKAHEALMARDKLGIRKLITERAYPEMMHNAKCTTIRWKLLQSLEPPRVVHARQTNLVTQENIFAQITVRLHTQQTLAIYDRFGRLMHGSEIIAKDVLEYVVYECNISNEYGTWRLHSKIVPDWAEPKQPGPMTYRVVEEAPQEAVDESAVATSQEAAIESVQIADGSSKSPPVATA